MGAFSLCSKPILDNRDYALKIVLSLKRFLDRITLLLREVVYESNKFLKIISFRTAS
jgi:hypothetical protein